MLVHIHNHITNVKCKFCDTELNSRDATNINIMENYVLIGLTCVKCSRIKTFKINRNKDKIDEENRLRYEESYEHYEKWTKLPPDYFTSLPEYNLK